MASVADSQKDHGQSHHESENEDRRGLCEECEIGEAYMRWTYEACRVALCSSNLRILMREYAHTRPPSHHLTSLRCTLPPWVKSEPAVPGSCRNLAQSFLPKLLGPEEHPPLRSQPTINPPSQLQNFISPSDRLPININTRDPARQRLHYCVHCGNACTRHRN
ncbi:hypothetical protein JMJ77_0005792 [Colletotrichum scovillei]|uniref:Uncharacterized protein n=1 Tax=Colletotrichum scovillei TaxID=1209932 RepID=A0A9P7RHJ3_9PEZI|nr:hypothetical protein JMJ77_0005792 [Colletotrichum scovillei]KAG7077051.1 hypothetical protein JMJ76_0014305 [Colletotrichum scovillei]